MGKGKSGVLGACPWGDSVPPNPPGIFRFIAEAGGLRIETATTEDKALQGWNLSAGGGPELGGGVTALPPLPFPWASMETVDDELIELPQPAVRVPVTPQWAQEQRDKQRRYEKARAAWRARLARSEE